MHGSEYDGGIAGIVARCRVDLLEAAVVFLVDDDESDVRIRQENSRTRTNDNLMLRRLRLTKITYLFPHLYPFVGAITRMIHA